MDVLRRFTRTTLARLAEAWIAPVIMLGAVALFGSSTAVQSGADKDTTMADDSIGDETTQGIYVEEDADQWCYPPVCEP